MLRGDMESADRETSIPFQLIGQVRGRILEKCPVANGVLL